ncbi:ABC transporter ATP-binding protein [Slackia exigua]|nr:ABC transporter ATP-binding protein [Slackia exigua]
MNRESMTACGLAYSYPRCACNVFEDIDVHVEPGSFMAILGNNGAGKSTLLDLLAGIARPSAGEVSVCGQAIASMSRRLIARHIAYVGQQQTVPHLTVYDEVLLGRRPHVGWGLTDHDREVVARAIARLGFEGYSRRYCDELSGGERQKAFIARALAQEPKVLILDEPTSALDPKNQLEVLRLIRDVTHRDGLATIAVLHDVNLALRFCDEFLLVRNGVPVACGGREVVDSRNLSETYGASFNVIEIDGMRIALPAAC